jgi:hypothetical protein
MARKTHKTVSRPSPQRIRQAFRSADEQFDGDRSTEFLGAYVADQLGIEYGDVFDALAETRGAGDD